MIAGIFHEGSGLGNQLHRYVAARCLAKKKGFDFGMANPHLFKGGSFMQLDMGKAVDTHALGNFIEKRIDNELGVDVRGYDSSINKVKDDTLIDGEFQDFKYFGEYLDDIRQWFSVPELNFPIPFWDWANTCVISFRGGEYVGVQDLFLPKKYWDDAMERIREINPKVRFGVVTDDIYTAQQFFPNLPIRHEMSEDWRMIYGARYLILSNSSFAIFPTLLNKKVEKVIAPFGWARHNITDGWFATEQNKYPGWDYIDRENEVHNF